MVLLPNRRASNGQTEQLRQARAQVQSKTRSDWNFPTAPYALPSYYCSAASTSAISTWNTPPAAGQDARDLVNEHIRQHPVVLDERPAPAKPTVWRERYYSDGEDSASENGDSNASPAYDSPDSVGADLEARKQQRRRRRQQRFEHEMKENIGLAHWSAQRNKWTGAESRDVVQEDLAAASLVPGQLQSTEDPSPAYTTSTSSTLAAAVPDRALWVPVAEPLLPNDPIRNRINNNAYSDIYTKVILQGRTPSIPISLTDVTRSLVHGWKEEGQWPPKPTPAEPSLVKKNGHPHIKGVLKQLGRPFGLSGQGVPVEKGSANAHEKKLARPSILSRRKDRANQAEEIPECYGINGPHRDAAAKVDFETKVREAKQAGVDPVERNPNSGNEIPPHVAEARLNHLDLFLQERSWRRAHQDLQAHNQRLAIFPAQGKRESVSRYNARILARCKQLFEGQDEYQVRMQAHHARVTIDNGPLFDEDEDWETIMARARDLGRKVLITRDRVRQGFQDGGEYRWRWSWERALLWHFDPIDKRKRAIENHKLVTRNCDWGAAG
ncbi:hypothetical protein QM012_002147 [Aureobasidium pullulans]|uniref:Gag1-like clamp domain-containing protein n=1 Tax=Aureobasidium pullulans TaxID=5580 RepID=A0ABR0TBZ9_AURPU